MKKKILMVIAGCCLYFSVMAQHDHGSHQKQSTTSNIDSAAKAAVPHRTSQQQLLQLLLSYLNIKNALVTGDATSAASNANQFLRTVNAIDFKVISESNIHILAKDAGKISAAKDIKKQREYFANLSVNMATIAKSLKLSSEPVYLQYCPMKKASWLSTEKQIRNPYYGSSMLTCGQVTDTL